MAARTKRTPAQTSFIKSTPQVKNGDVLDVAEAAALLKVSKETIYKRVRDNKIPHARLGRKLLFHRQTLVQWVADGGDKAESEDGEQLTLEQMLNSGKARVASKR